MLPRSYALRSRALAQPLRRPVPARHIGGRRFQSTNPSANNGAWTFVASHALAGVAGGLTVVAMGYGYYHFSDLKSIVQTATQTSNQVKSYLDSARTTILDSARSTSDQLKKNPSEVLKSLRHIAKSYAGFIPGASGRVDTVFDELDELHDQHGEKMDEIVMKARDEVVGIVKDGSVDVGTAQKVFEVMKRTVSEMQGLGVTVGAQLLDKFPGVKEKLGGSYDEMRKLADSRGEEGKKVLDETVKKLQDMFTKGTGSDSIDNARQLLEEGTDKLQKLAEDSQGKLSYKWEILQTFAKSAPGGQEALEKLPHVKDFVAVAGEKSDEAKQLAKETFQDIMNLLEEKGKKAQKLKEKAKEDAEGKAKKS